MFQALELPADDVPSVRPVSPVQGSRLRVEDPEKQHQRHSPPTTVTPPVTTPYSNGGTTFSTVNDQDIMFPGVVRVEGPSLPQEPSIESDAIEAELAEEIVPIEVTCVGETRDQSGKRRNLCTWIAVVLSIGATVVALVLVFASLSMIGNGPGDGSSNSEPSQGAENPVDSMSPAPSQPNPESATPTPQPSMGPSKAPVPFSQESEWIGLIQNRSPLTTFEDVASPQKFALDWMLQDPFTLELNDNNRIIQRFALAVVYFATGGPTSWNQGGGWLDSSDECQWRGITYDLECSRGFVDKVLLSGDGLSGTIPIEIGLLVTLTYLDLFSNDISGTLPTEMGLISSLTYLSVSLNNFKGTIPSEIGLLTSLSTGSFYRNELQGTIPTEIGLLGSLTSLTFYSNSLQGSVPSEIGLLTSINELSLGENYLSNTVPTEVGRLSGLVGLSFFNNTLSGTIPTEIGLLSALTSAIFSENYFHGTIPSEIGLITALSARLSFHTNTNLTGGVPSEFANLVNLTRLSLYHTALSGSIPSTLCETLTHAQIDCAEIECGCCYSFDAGLPC